MELKGIPAYNIQGCRIFDFFVFLRMKQSVTDMDFRILVCLAKLPVAKCTRDL